MVTLKNLYNIGNYFLFSLWGITLIDVLAVFQFDNVKYLESVDEKTKLFMFIVGAFFFVLKIVKYIWTWYNEAQDRKIDIKIKNEELEKLEKENDNI